MWLSESGFTETFSVTASEKPQEAWSRPDAWISMRLHSAPSKCKFDPNWKHKCDWARFTTGDREVSWIAIKKPQGSSEDVWFNICVPIESFVWLKWNKMTYFDIRSFHCHYWYFPFDLSSKSLESEDHTPRSQIRGLIWLFIAAFDARMVNKTLKRLS